MVLALPSNISLGWEWKIMTNTLAYYNTLLIKIVKGFIVQAPWVYNGCFMSKPKCWRVRPIDFHSDLPSTYLFLVIVLVGLSLWLAVPNDYDEDDDGGFAALWKIDWKLNNVVSWTSLLWD